MSLASAGGPCRRPDRAAAGCRPGRTRRPAPARRRPRPARQSGSGGAGPAPRRTAAASTPGPVRSPTGHRRRPGSGGGQPFSASVSAARLPSGPPGAPGICSARATTTSRSCGTPARTCRGVHRRGPVVRCGRQAGARAARPPRGQRGVGDAGSALRVPPGRVLGAGRLDAADGGVDRQPADLDLAVAGAQHVLGLQAQVREAGLVGRVERTGDVQGEVAGLGRRQRSVREQVDQAGGGDPLADDVDDAVDLAGVQDPQEPRVGEAAARRAARRTRSACSASASSRHTPTGRSSSSSCARQYDVPAASPRCLSRR